jgi:hypothetical protein
MEPLYEHLKAKIPGVEIHENGAVPNINEYDKETSKLMIIDDLVLEKKPLRLRSDNCTSASVSSDGVQYIFRNPTLVLAK